MEPRTYIIKKSPHLGYGFVAGNESPTVVKHIQPDGPSYNRLLPGDVIMAVNGINVENSSREEIVKMIQLNNSHIEIKVRQLTFEEAVVKIFFELGYTRVLNYNPDTTVRDLLDSINTRLIENSTYSEQIKRYFGIVLTVDFNSEGKMKARKLHVLDENDSITKLRQLSYAPSLRLIYRMIHLPNDVKTLYAQDKIAFEYLYQQSCNDLKLERFRPDLDEETYLKLSALHLLEHVYTYHSKAHKNSKDPKVFIDLVKDDPGLKHFVPNSTAEKIFDKKGKIVTTPYKKLKTKIKENLANIFENHDLDNSSDNLSDHVKLLFLNNLSQLPCYGNSERPPVRTSPSSLTSSLDRTSDSFSLIRQDESTSIINQNDRLLEDKFYDNSSRIDDTFNNHMEEKFHHEQVVETKQFQKASDQFDRRSIIYNKTENINRYQNRVEEKYFDRANQEKSYNFNNYRFQKPIFFGDSSPSFWYQSSISLLRPASYC